jgi:hypothetical protein
MFASLPLWCVGAPPGVPCLEDGACPHLVGMASCSDWCPEHGLAIGPLYKGERLLSGQGTLQGSLYVVVMPS